MNRGVAVSFTVKLEVPAQVYILAIFSTFLFHAKCCMGGKRIRCLQIARSMYPSIFNSFPAIRTASAKNRRFQVPQPTFLFPLETPLRQSRNTSVSVAVCELFIVKPCNLENLVKGRSRSLKMAPFDRPYATFYWSAIVNIALSCTIFELFDVE